jgi:hypothetical protein
MDDMYEDMADKGRKGDTYVGHLTGGEMVVPVAVLDAEDGFLRKAINGAMKDMEVNPDQFTVGHEDNSVNPETGQIEFGLGSWIKRKVFRQKVKGPSAAERKAVAEAKARIEKQQKELDARKVTLDQQKQAAFRARRGRGGSYSLLSSQDTLGG